MWRLFLFSHDVLENVTTCAFKFFKHQRTVTPLGPYCALERNTHMFTHTHFVTIKAWLLLLL